jgi:hypothetical protein
MPILPMGGITRVLHCAICLRELKDMDNVITPADYAQMDVGTNEAGDLIIWCRRHSAPALKIENARIADVLKRAGGSQCQGHQHPVPQVH